MANFLPWLPAKTSYKISIQYDPRFPNFEQVKLWEVIDYNGFSCAVRKISKANGQCFIIAEHITIRSEFDLREQ